LEVAIGVSFLYFFIYVLEISTFARIIELSIMQVLDYCNASPKEYKCIFTSGATAALKLVGEAFPWNCSSSFMYTMENHNSVLGIREYPTRLKNDTLFNFIIISFGQILDTEG